MKISTSDGTIETIQRTHSTLMLAVLTSLGSAGTFSGQTMLTMKIQPQNSLVQRSANIVKMASPPILRRLAAPRNIGSPAVLCFSEMPREAS